MVNIVNRFNIKFWLCRVSTTRAKNSIPLSRNQSGKGRQILALSNKMPSSKASKNKNNSSTRLPPKTQQRKQAGKPAKVNVKKILMEETETKERLKDTLESLTERLIAVLDSGGVPKERTKEIQRQLVLVFDNSDTSTSLTEQLQSNIVVLSDATKVVEKSWSYCHCYPSMDVPALSSILDELQTVLCESAFLANKPVQRKLVNLQADPKADAAVLNELEGVSKQVSGKRTTCSCLLCLS